MRKTLTALFIAAALPTFAMAAPAANDLPPPPMEGGHMMGQHGPRHGGPMKELDLTREQRQQMGKLMGEQMKARHEITQRYLAKLPAAEQKALKDELKASHEKTQKDIRALLTPEQQKKFDELQKKREQRKAEGRIPAMEGRQEVQLTSEPPLPGPPVAVFRPAGIAYPRGLPSRPARHAIQQENHAFTLLANPRRLLAGPAAGRRAVHPVGRALNQDTWIIARHPGLKDLAEQWTALYEEQGSYAAQGLLEQRRRDYGISIQVLDESGQRLVDGTYLPRPHHRPPRTSDRNLPRSWRQLSQEYVSPQSNHTYLFIYRIPHPELEAWHRGSLLWPLSALGIALVVLTLFSLLLTLSITRPLNCSRRAVHDLGQTAYQKDSLARLARRGDELGTLARDFNRMGERLQSLIGSQRQLLRDVSHELRSPLARLRIALALAERAELEARAQMWPRLEQECDRLEALIGEILARPARRRTRREPTDRPATAAPAAARRRPAAGSGTGYPPGGGANLSIDGWPDMFERAVDNLLRNAVRFNPVGQPLEVRASSAGDYLRLSVRDHGPGIAAELQEQLASRSSAHPTRAARDTAWAGHRPPRHRAPRRAPAPGQPSRRRLHRHPQPAATAQGDRMTLRPDEQFPGASGMTLPASLFLDERPLAQAIAPPPEPPGDEPQSLVLAVELGQVAQQLRHRWARLDLNLPERGTWPLESWRPALHEALYGLLGGAAQARPWQRITPESGAGRTPRPAAPGHPRPGGRRPALAAGGRKPPDDWPAGRADDCSGTPRARIGAYACCCCSARPGADEGRRVEFRRRAQLAHRRTQVDEADDPLLLAEPQAGVHHRIGGHLAGPPHRPNSA